MTPPTPTPEDLDRIVRWLRAGSADDPDYTIATNDDAADIIESLRRRAARITFTDPALDHIETNLRGACDHERDDRNGMIGCNWCGIADAIAALRAQLSQLHAAGMPTDIDSAVVWIDRLVAKCVDSDTVVAENETLRAQVAEAHRERDHWKRTCEQAEDRLTAERKRADRVVAAFVCTGRGVTILVDSADELRAAIVALGGDHAE